MAIDCLPTDLRRLTTGVVLCLLGSFQTAHAQDTLPHLRKQGDATHLVVDGEPMLMLGGELGNASAASLAFMEHQGRGTMTGVRPPIAFDGTVDEAPQTVLLGDYVFEVSFVDPWTPREEQRTEAHGGLIIALDDDTFLAAGTGLTITFAPQGPGDPIAGIDRIEEGTMIDGKWQPGRVLNGDQSHQGRHLRLPPGEAGMQRVTLYRYH